MASTDLPSCAGPRKDGQSAPDSVDDEATADTVAKATAARKVLVIMLLQFGHETFFDVSG